MAKIIAKIAKDGTTTLKVEGVSGTTCTDLTKAMEQALGTVTQRDETGEYYEAQVTEEQKLNLGGGQ